MADEAKATASVLSIKRRVPIKSSPLDFVTAELLPSGATLPVMIRPFSHDVDPVGWAGLARDEILSLLARHGGVLFRGFDISSELQFQRFIQALSGDPLPYTERSSPRTQVKGNIYTSTDHPPDQSIFLHCENSYQKTWPLKIFFYCHTKPEHGGETPIADVRRVLARIDPAVCETFRQKGVLYVRNFGNGLGLAWQTVFQTESRHDVEEYCRAAGIECQWHDGNRLTTRHVRKAVRKHPHTGDDVWFNHAVFFHFSTLPVDAQSTLQALLCEEELPNNTYYGDGTPIPSDVLDHLRNAYAEETVYFPWTHRDVLMLDNMLAAHGRSPYSGARKILVGMSEPYSE
jgi:alpha-ketoglutarate-dependent taurine dioxygenase